MADKKSKTAATTATNADTGGGVSPEDHIARVRESLAAQNTARQGIISGYERAMASEMGSASGASEAAAGGTATGSTGAAGPTTTTSTSTGGSGGGTSTGGSR
jgi:hypothetical protein